MKIKKIMVGAIAFSVAMMSAPASSAVFYEWSGESVFGSNRVEASFSFESEATINGFQNIDLSKANCVARLNTVSVGCLRVFLDPNFFGVNGIVSVTLNPVNDRFGSSIAYQINDFFPLNSFNTSGTYQGQRSRLIVTNTAAAVPEPATWAMFIIGLGLIGGAMRQRKAIGATPSLA